MLFAHVPFLEWHNGRVELILIQLDDGPRVEEDPVEIRPIPDGVRREFRRREPGVQAFLVCARLYGLLPLHHRLSVPDLKFLLVRRRSTSEDRTVER